MLFDEYQAFCRTTAVYPAEHALDYLIHGLTSEAGEVAGKRKKHLRGDAPDDAKEQIVAEIGDVLWYVAEIASVLGFSLEEVATLNAVKLRNRQAAGTLKGDGDKR